MRRRYEFADDALVDEDGDGDAEDADEGEVAMGPAEVVLQVLSAGAPVLDEPVLVHLHPSPHFDPPISFPFFCLAPLFFYSFISDWLGYRVGRCYYTLG